jgi:hypothetical protein
MGDTIMDETPQNINADSKNKSDSPDNLKSNDKDILEKAPQNTNADSKNKFDLPDNLKSNDKDNKDETQQKNNEDSVNQSTYFDNLVKLNLVNLIANSQLVKNQTKGSVFLASVVGFIGLILIIMGLVVGLIRQDTPIITYLSFAAGIIIEIISGILFYQHNKMICQLKGYHDNLLDVQNILLSFKLIEGTKDVKEKSLLIHKMIESFVKKKSFDPTAMLLSDL